ncbi:MAG: hypothetical protein ABIR84_13155 [Candidatus Nitrotoga sp.]
MNEGMSGYATLTRPTGLAVVDLPPMDDALKAQTSDVACSLTRKLTFHGKKAPPLPPA